MLDVRWEGCLLVMFARDLTAREAEMKNKYVEQRSRKGVRLCNIS